MAGLRIDCGVPGLANVMVVQFQDVIGEMKDDFFYESDESRLHDERLEREQPFHYAGEVRTN